MMVPQEQLLEFLFSTLDLNYFHYCLCYSPNLMYLEIRQVQCGLLGCIPDTIFIYRSLPPRAAAISGYQQPYPILLKFMCPALARVKHVVNDLMKKIMFPSAKHITHRSEAVRTKVDLDSTNLDRILQKFMFEIYLFC